GHWKIVSGIHAADWFIAVGVVTENGQPRITQAGAPDIRLCAVRRDQLKVDDTWNVSGMRGTGSNDVLVENAFIPTDLVTPSLDTPARIDRKLYRGFFPALVFPGCTAVVIGVAQSAIDEMVKLASGKKAFAGGTIAEAARPQYTLAKSETDLHAGAGGDVRRGVFVGAVPRQSDRTLLPRRHGGAAARQPVHAVPRGRRPRSAGAGPRAATVLNTSPQGLPGFPVTRQSQLSTFLLVEPLTREAETLHSFDDKGMRGYGTSAAMMAAVVPAIACRN